MVFTARTNGVEGAMLPPTEPTSPREPRRSGRRSLPLAHASAASSSTPKSDSKSNSPVQEESAAIANMNPPQIKRRKSVKDENEENGLLEFKHPKRDGGTEPKANKREKLMVDTKLRENQGKGRAKRKSKAAKEEKVLETPVEEALDPNQGTEGDEADGKTRCVCGNTTGATEEDDDYTFWIQCETCKVWQHGRCVGYESVAEAPEHYHCEQCRPDLHEELLSKMIKTPKARPPSLRALSRSSRSHSPTHAAMAMALLTPIEKAPKRRNTMNSRETAYHDEMMKQVQDGGVHMLGESFMMHEGTSVAASSVHPDEDGEIRETYLEMAGKKKRRSMTAPVVDQLPKARSESSTSDRPIASTIIDQQVPLAPEEPEEEVPALATPAPSQRSRKRGSRKEGGESRRHPNQYTYRRSNAARDNTKSQGAQGANSTAQTPAPALHEHGTRRNPQSTRNQHLPAPQPLLTSWGLPDYLAHLTPLLPTPVPVPLRIPISSAAGGSLEEERGVKVKWPGKRMSVIDMGKRVRQLMEWVGREQGNHAERERRRIGIEQAVAEEVAVVATQTIEDINGPAEGVKMDVDEPLLPDHSKSNPPNPDADAIKVDEPPNVSPMKASPTDDTPVVVNGYTHNSEDNQSQPEKATALLMEELMLDLISFQEKYGAQTKMNELMSL